MRSLELLLLREDQREVGTRLRRRDWLRSRQNPGKKPDSRCVEMILLADCVDGIARVLGNFMSGRVMSGRGQGGSLVQHNSVASVGSHFRSLTPSYPF